MDVGPFEKDKSRESPRSYLYLAITDFPIVGKLSGTPVTYLETYYFQITI